MTIKPLAYINVEERKLEWADPITWHTPTIAKMEKIPLYIIPNTEPVAWTDGKGHYFDKNSFFPVDDLTPLYTHPAKTLTDEEIVDIIQRLTAKWTDEFKNYENDSDEPEENKLRDDVFAILRKAQEK
jgi:hypothetical protein